MKIVEVRPDDAPTLAAWHATHVRSQLHERPHATPWLLPELRAALEDRDGRHRVTGFAGLVDGHVATAGSLALPMWDNLESAEVEVDTDPAHRRRGHGSTMLRHLESLAVSAGRHLANTEVRYPYDGPADGAGQPDVDFATRRGYLFGLGDVQRRLDLPVAETLLERLAGEAAPHHAAYRVESFSGPVPERRLDSFAVISASLMTEAPVGEVERQPESADPDLVRQGEALLRAQGRRSHRSLAIDPAGEVVAFTTAVTSEHHPETCFQWGTVVRRGDRGHRLGLALKVTNLRHLRREAPSLSRMFTYNAEVNAHMVAVNDLLGFVPVGRLAELQKRLVRP